MKAEINPNGKLIVSPETETESYAFYKWLEDNQDIIMLLEGKENIEITPLKQ